MVQPANQAKMEPSASQTRTSEEFKVRNTNSQNFEDIGATEDGGIETGTTNNETGNQTYRYRELYGSNLPLIPIPLKKGLY